MSRTRRWSFVAQEAQRLANLGLSEREIAKRVGVAKSTITRAKKSGRLVVTLTRSTPPPGEPPTPRLEPAAWARSVREDYQLDATDEALVTLAEAALSLSRSMTATVREQLAGSQRFQALVRQLNLPGRRISELANQPPLAVASQAPARTTNPAIRRSSRNDPRRALLAVVPK